VLVAERRERQLIAVDPAAHHARAAVVVSERRAVFTGRVIPARHPVKLPRPIPSGTIAPVQSVSIMNRASFRHLARGAIGCGTLADSVVVVIVMSCSFLLRLDDRNVAPGRCRACCRR
jgi:hypothetical protein